MFAKINAVMKKIIFILLLVLFFIFSIGIEVFAMSSDKYKMDDDSINFGGTENSSDGLFLLSDSLGEVGTGISSSSQYSLSAGYRMVLQSSYISISAASDFSMPALSGIMAGQSNSSSSWTVKTDNLAGYEIMIKSSTTPAMKTLGSAYFSDYSPSSASGTPDYAFDVAATGSVFSFSPEGQDISQTYSDNGDDCGIGSDDTEDKCWDGFSITDKVIAYRTSSNHPDGIVTTVKYRSAIGDNKIQDSGTYTATITVTAVAL